MFVLPIRISSSSSESDAAPVAFIISFSAFAWYCEISSSSSLKRACACLQQYASQISGFCNLGKLLYDPTVFFPEIYVHFWSDLSLHRVLVGYQVVSDLYLLFVERHPTTVHFLDLNSNVLARWPNLYQCRTLFQELYLHLVPFKRPSGGLAGLPAPRL